jgi:hypothetical protein
VATEFPPPDPNGVLGRVLALNAQQLAIVLSSLARELEAAAASYPNTLPDLRRDTREAIRCVEAWCRAQEPHPQLAVPSIQDDTPVEILAEQLRVVAEQLWRLAEN